MSDPIAPLPTLEPDRLRPVWVVHPPRQRLWLHLLLLLATFVSTLVVGSRMEFNFLHRQSVFSLNDEALSLFPVDWILEQPSRLLLGLPFSLTLMSILLAHEMGHYLYARHYRVYATLPFFVPFPSLIGTLGAFIRIRGPIQSRTALFDIGIAGPIAGFIPSCAAVLTGLFLSHPLLVANPPDSNEPGFPIAFQLAARLLHVQAPASLSLHPIALAGWVGMFATALNLLPGGQLDGGHILYAVFPRFHRIVSLLTVLALIPLTKYFWMGWLVWSILLWTTSRHPPVPLQPDVPQSRRWLALLAVVILTLAFTPTPITHASGLERWPQIRNDSKEKLQLLINAIRHALHRP